jgi:FtsZ-binding cell division protein ZapB
LRLEIFEGSVGCHEHNLQVRITLVVHLNHLPSDGVDDRIVVGNAEQEAYENNEGARQPVYIIQNSVSSAKDVVNARKESKKLSQNHGSWHDNSRVRDLLGKMGERVDSGPSLGEYVTSDHE